MGMDRAYQLIHSSVHLSLSKGQMNQTHVVLLSELLGQGGRHDLPLEAGRGREVRLARLAAVRSEACSFQKR